MNYSIIDLNIELKKIYDKFRKEYKEYAKIIKEEAKKFFKNNFVSLVIFGSTVKGNIKPLSDIDIAVILNKSVDEFQRAKFRTIINRKFGINPFEIHIIDKEMWEKWYKNFVKKDFIEI